MSPSTRFHRQAQGRRPRQAIGTASRPAGAPVVPTTGRQRGTTTARRARRAPTGKRGGLLGWISCGCFAVGVMLPLMSVAHLVNAAAERRADVGDLLAVGVAAIGMWLAFVAGAVVAAVELATVQREKTWGIIGVVLNGGALLFLAVSIARHAG